MCLSFGIGLASKDTHYRVNTARLGRLKTRPRDLLGKTLEISLEAPLTKTDLAMHQVVPQRERLLIPTADAFPNHAGDERKAEELSFPAFPAFATGSCQASGGSFTASLARFRSLGLAKVSLSGP